MRLSAPVAFALDRPVAFELEPPAEGAASALQLAPRWSGEVGLRLAAPGAPLVGDPTDDGRATTDLRTPPGVRYVAYSRDAGASADPAPEGEALAATLQLPATLSPRVRERAQRLTASAPGAAERVQAIVTWLRATHRYTLRLPRPTPGVDPVESFLFDTTEGHCEYFATATALLLRAGGVPTRYVNGYLGGEWNDVGRYVAVRDNRAHSWIEAYVPASGWTRVDATPPLAPPTRAGRLSQVLDALDFRWSRWVVGYDLARQLDLWPRRAARHLGLRGPEAPWGHGHLPGWLLVVLAVGAVAAAAFARLGRRGDRRRERPRAPPPSRVHARAAPLRARARSASRAPECRGRAPRRPSASTRRASRAPASTAAPSLAELTELYTAARFGGRPVDREALQRLARGIASLGQVATAR